MTFKETLSTISQVDSTIDMKLRTFKLLHLVKVDMSQLNLKLDSASFDLTSVTPTSIHESDFNYHIFTCNF